MQGMDETIPTFPATAGTLGRVSIFCILVYIMLYAFESPVRYVLYLTGTSTLILLRDGLVVLPLGLIFLRDLLRSKVRPAFGLFALFAAVGSAVSWVNFASTPTLVLGLKELLGAIFGLVAGTALIDTSKRVHRIFIAIWIVTVIGVVLEKFVVTFPWVGLHATIGNLDIEISRDWQVSDQFQKRVGGFTRVSIAAAGLMPLLALVAVSRVKSFSLRNAIFLITIGAVFLTTQKGALLAIAFVWLVNLVPLRNRVPVQVAAALLCILVDIMLPILTNGIHVATGSGGSYSSSSFMDRIVITWPDTLEWIGRGQIFPFGLGLGGIGEAQRFVSSKAYHYPDNLFLFLLGSFGAGSILLFGVIVRAALRGLVIAPEVAGGALSVLTFIVLYGSFVSIIEDQMEALFLGASVATLLAAPRMTAAARALAPRRRSQPREMVAEAAS